MPQSIEDSSTTVHGYQSISQPAPLPDTSWLPATAQAPNLPTPGTGATSSVLVLPLFFLQLPPGWKLLTTPSGQTSLCCSHLALGSQRGPAGSHRLAWAPSHPQPDTACPKPPNVTTLPSCHSPGRDRDSKDSHPRCCHSHWSTTC